MYIKQWRTQNFKMGAYKKFDTPLKPKLKGGEETCQGGCRGVESYWGVSTPLFFLAIAKALGYKVNFVHRKPESANYRTAVYSWRYSWWYT